MSKSCYCVLVILILTWNIVQIAASFSCKNENGDDVDWIISYKLPRLTHSVSLIKKGLAHLILEPNSTSWSFSKQSITNKTSFLGQILQPLFARKKEKANNSFYILYNDEHPDGNVSYYKGHTKGVVAFNKTSGFWLIHSVPKFPPFTHNVYSYPESGEVYGQSFLCISFNFSAADDIGKLLLYNNPFIYDYNLPDKFKDTLPSISAVVKNKHPSVKPWNITTILPSRKNQTFMFFAKYKDFDKDLYSSWLAPHLEVDLVTETWQHGPKSEKLNSSCSSRFTVENIQTVLFTSLKVSYNSTHDHSKLAISKDSSKPWVCIGDINRMETQMKRGGGTACLNSYSHWKLFHQLVLLVESCSAKS